MSLNNVDIKRVIRQQFSYKCKANTSLFTSMIVIQLIAVLFSLSGTGMIGTSIGYNGVSIQFYSGDIVLVFTMIWAFITAIMLTTKTYTETDYVFVANHLTSNLSNIAFLFVASVIGAITSLLAVYLLKVVMLLFFDHGWMAASQEISVGQWVSGFLTTIFYLFMFSAIGYLIGQLTQRNKLFIVIIPAFIIGSLVIFVGSTILMDISQFYFNDSSFFSVFIKTVGTSFILFLISMVLSNGQEVRK
ncbi:hypothetical protein D8M04_15500 [Oceanobacillus piezotolerans]|uniref:Uncharacterized protein n=1 Tax=Oceanobacillus piezotolerans TaxID=2448030 RepID=A0A498D2Q5_9BACI|nr:hypothetical protein [Oceanobacillus piezotolerans]RLL41992.1 hypothetical protein D8M04_15500 [Oceanobacillus piezotolerans]